MLRDQEVLDDASPDEMFLNDPLERGRVTLAVPGALGIHDRDGSALADPQAVHFGAQDATLVREPEIGQPFLQELPGLHAPRQVAALRLRLFSAEKDMTAGHGHADRFCDLPL